jgi:ADP-ribosylglycohydrolase
MGYIKHAFILAFYFLINYDGREDYFKWSIENAIKLGGDTDTNACIVGQMVGAIVGF